MQLMKKEPLIVVVSNTARPTDLGGWITMEQTAATVANLIRCRLPQYPKVLDVGCGGGMLAGELPPSVHYLGIDASESTIEAAQSLWGGDDIRFEALDIREFDPVGNWDAVIFSEVLSYLAVHEAITEVRRYAKALSPHNRHQHDERRKEPRDLARVATRVSMDRRYSLATKGAVALLPDQREPRAPGPSRRRAPSAAEAPRRQLIHFGLKAKRAAMRQPASFISCNHLRRDGGFSTGLEKLRRDKGEEVTPVAPNAPWAGFDGLRAGRLTTRDMTRT